KVVNERFEELKQKETVLQKLNAQVSHYQAKEKQLADAERAARMEPYEKQVAEARQDEQRRTKTLQTAEQNKQTADIALKRMEAAYQEEENKKDDREKLNRLKEYLPAVKEMDERKNHLQQLEAKAKEAYKSLQAVQADVKEKKKQAESYQQDIKTMDEAVSQLPDKHLRLTEMREKVKVLFDYKKLTENQVALEKDLQKKKQEWDKRKTTYTTLENTWLNNQAIMLASHL